MRAFHALEDRYFLLYFLSFSSTGLLPRTKKDYKKNQLAKFIFSAPTALLRVFNERVLRDRAACNVAQLALLKEEGR
jgi:hypothetical protein